MVPDVDLKEIQRKVYILFSGWSVGYPSGLFLVGVGDWHTHPHSCSYGCLVYRRLLSYMGLQEAVHLSPDRPRKNIRGAEDSIKANHRRGHYLARRSTGILLSPFGWHARLVKGFLHVSLRGDNRSCRQHNRLLVEG